jgi:hypothetical protein
MEDIFEEIHNEFINSEEFTFYIKEMLEFEEKLTILPIEKDFVSLQYERHTTILYYRKSNQRL